jgi:hypothetical protein
VFGAGWGSLGGGGAWEREWSRLGNTQGAVVLVRAFVRSERQRGGVDFKVLDPVLCPERGRRWRLGFTLMADRWGGVAYWVCVPAW